MQEQFDALGIELPDELREAEEAESECEFHPDNRLALVAWVSLQTQWRLIVGASGTLYQGIEYASIPVVLDSLRVPARQRPQLLADLRVMERAALTLLNAKADDGG